MKLQDFHNKHKGETIYILASGPELATLSDLYKDFLKTQVTISVNHSFLAMPLNYTTYWISGHWSMVHLVKKLGDRETIKFFAGQGSGLNPYPGFIRIRRVMYSPGILPQQTNNIVSIKNVIFSALHLAYILGASQIKILGLEMVNGLHFWNYDPALSTYLHTTLTNLLKSKKLHPLAKKEIESNLKTIFDIEKCKFYRFPDHSKEYQSIIETLISKGVDVCYTADKGILTKTKARHVNY